MNVPFMDLARIHEPLKDQLDVCMHDVIKTNAFILGSYVERFERNFARYSEVLHSVGVSNGSDALELILKGYEIGNGDGVIVPANTFIATATAIRSAGANPVIVDVGSDYNIDHEKIEEAITDRTKAIIPVHLYGQTAAMDPILDIAKEYDLIVIEDACQAHGAEYMGSKAGSIGHAAAFSFYPTKNLGAFGDAGIVVSDDGELINKIRMLRNYGQSEKYHHDVFAFNRRMDELQAAVLDIKLSYLDKWNNQRREIAQIYRFNLITLVDEGKISLPEERDGRKHVYHLFVICTEKRDDMASYLSKLGIGTGLHYPIPVHLQKCFSDLGYKNGDFPETERQTHSILSLPMFPGMRREEVEYVCGEISNFFQDD